ncbi:ATP phosphoribosyltransferase regulatory subunit [Oscillatoria sp. FACHB-1407]|uniref:ATP phosphoribosyltransferase regulatory subunit n=1 Tax=Oscillatoria sp. FACHB-1407 TaxID=2692847 RepID=UPI001685BB6D|nr:ATP phosphoribosyltransferase regulatory subunit [Oscillatoria sp. FACHB-1407]MBD2465448.1 ATP phosphoribosyltransferase regulatory subunit [Oscillatoria sp. FACHB-1407]
MVYQPPVGARDLLPLDVAQKRWIEDRLQNVFHRWGYHRIITSTLERMDTLMAGGAVQQSTVIQLQEIENEALGLRPELTASIARAAVTRMAGATLPQRLYYNANVFRRAAKGSHTSQQEFYQAGVELIGGGGVVADAEVLLLLSDCMNSLELDSWYLILGEAGLTRSLLSAFPESVREQVRGAIATLDRLSLETLPLSDELRERALLLFDLRGRPADVLQRVSKLDLDATQRNAVNNLKSLIELLEETSAAQARPTPPLILDLSLIQTLDYYTGIVFEVISGSAGQRVLGQGGRYDQLLGLYHPQGETHPGIGFVFNIEELHQTLLPTGRLPLDTPPSHWLVVPITPQAQAAAFAYAHKIRESTNLVRVEVDLSHHPDAETTRAYAQRRNISQIAWIQADGQPEIEQIG